MFTFQNFGLALILVVVLLGCSEEIVQTTELKVTKAVGLKTTDALVASMHRVMGSPAYSGSSVRGFLANFESSLSVDGSIHSLSSPLIMTQIGLGSYFCDRGLETDRVKADAERLFLQGVSWNHNLSNNQPSVEARQAYYRRLVENIMGVPPEKKHLDELEQVYQNISGGYASKSTGNFRLTLKAVCTAAMGSIHLALVK